MEPTQTSDARGRSFPLTVELREILTRQIEKTAELERGTGRVAPWLFHRDGKPIKDFRKAWALACQRAGVAGKVPDDFRRTAVRNLERAGVPRSTTMAIVDIAQNPSIVAIAMADDMTLRESVAKLAAFHKSGKTG